MIFHFQVKSAILQHLFLLVLLSACSCWVIPSHMLHVLEVSVVSSLSTWYHLLSCLTETGNDIKGLFTNSGMLHRHIWRCVKTTHSHIWWLCKPRDIHRDVSHTRVKNLDKPHRENGVMFKICQKFHHVAVEKRRQCEYVIVFYARPEVRVFLFLSNSNTFLPSSPCIHFWWLWAGSGLQPSGGLQQLGIQVLLDTPDPTSSTFCWIQILWWMFPLQQEVPSLSPIHPCGRGFL